MTHENLIALQEYLKNVSGYDVYMGIEDIAGNSLPAVQIVLSGDIGINVMNTRLNTINDDIGIRVIVEKNDELEAFRIRDDIIMKINKFQEEKGHETELIEGSKDYTDNTFEITLTYNIKNIIQDT